MKPLRVALLGLKGAGIRYRDALLADDQFQLVAIADADRTVQSVAQVHWEEFSGMGRGSDDTLLRSSDASVDSFF